MLIFILKIVLFHFENTKTKCLFGKKLYFHTKHLQQYQTLYNNMIHNGTKNNNYMNNDMTICVNETCKIRQYCQRSTHTNNERQSVDNFTSTDKVYPYNDTTETVTTCEFFIEKQSRFMRLLQVKINKNGIVNGSGKSSKAIISIEKTMTKYNYFLKGWNYLVIDSGMVQKFAYVFSKTKLHN